MSNAQAERAINQLFESDTVRSELRDEEASLLLTWGEARLVELAERNLPDEQFDGLAAKLRSLLVAVNYCVGRRKTMPSQHLSMMAEITSAAEAAGYQVIPEEQTGFLRAQGVLSNDEAIAELLGLLRPVSAPSIVAEAVPTLPPAPETQAPPETEAPLPDFRVPVVSEHPPVVEPPLPPVLMPSDEAPFTTAPQTVDSPIQAPAPMPDVVPTENQTAPPPPDDLPEFPQSP